MSGTRSAAGPASGGAILVVDGGRVAELRDGAPVLLGVLPAGVAPTVFRPGARVVPAGAPPGMVVDVGESGTRVLRDGVLVRAIPLGGADLDRAVAAALPGGARPGDVRTVREALSLCPAATVGTTRGAVRVTAEQVRTAIRPVLARLVEGLPRGTPLLLVGGVARTPLLAELCDAAGVGPVRVAERPGTALVESGPGGAVGAADPAADGGWLLAPPPARRSRRVRWAVAGVVAAVALLGLGTVLPTPADGVVAHGYRFALPAGWAHVGGAPERRRVLLAPAGQPDATALVVVERTPLGYDADAEPARAAADLRARHAEAGAAVSALRVDGRWTRYREDAVDWAVRFEGADELAVGCRYPPGGSAAVDAACAQVRDSLVRDR
ncbi:type VII secretion-associated protein [Pseudonocardia xishanensis]|uniref:Type VII secretion-associated protein (TIGR03931 family) n=1 Tax=Pseudonocardia xishanensis TaxID=630995 RepID=A0ABP8RT19_9PSEU